MSARFRRVSWVVIASVVLISLVRGSIDDGPPRTTEEQVQVIASTMKCPICGGQSVADSDVAASRAIRLEIASLVEEGRSSSEVRSAISDAYGERVQLIPPSSGFAGLVWILPVVAMIVALGALSAAFARWRRAPVSAATDEDRALVEQALDRR